MKEKDFLEFRDLEPGDLHILQTEGKDPRSRHYEFVQRVSVVLDDSVPGPARRAVSDEILDDADYMYSWFGKEEPERLGVPEAVFDRVVQEVDEELRYTGVLQLAERQLREVGLGARALRRRRGFPRELRDQQLSPPDFSNLSETVRSDRALEWV